MTYREIVTHLIAQFEEAVKSEDLDKIQIAMLPFMALQDIDDGSADDLLQPLLEKMERVDAAFELLQAEITNS